MCNVESQMRGFCFATECDGRSQGSGVMESDGYVKGCCYGFPIESGFGGLDSGMGIVGVASREKSE